MAESISYTGPCDCCLQEEDGVLCWQHVEFSDPIPEGSPACETNYELSLTDFYFQAPPGDTLEQGVRSTVDGIVTIDCSQEESGYCRGIGASGTYGFNTIAIYESTEFYGDPNEPGSSASVNFTIEDCGNPGLPPPDMRINFLVERVRPGSLWFNSNFTGEPVYHPTSCSSPYQE
jgi:hypothetical protein